MGIIVLLICSIAFMFIEVDTINKLAGLIILCATCINWTIVMGFKEVNKKPKKYGGVKTRDMQLDNILLPIKPIYNPSSHIKRKEYPSAIRRIRDHISWYSTKEVCVISSSYIQSQRVIKELSEWLEDCNIKYTPMTTLKDLADGKRYDEMLLVLSGNWYENKDTRCLASMLIDNGVKVLPIVDIPRYTQG